MREEVHGLLRQQGVTTVLVTHDQEEALSLADPSRSCATGGSCSKDRRSISTSRPPTSALARFLGAVNVIDAQFEAAPHERRWARSRCAAAQGARRHAGAVVLVRPEQLEVALGCRRHRDRPDRWRPAGKPLEQCRYYGHDALLEIRPDGARRRR